MLVFIMVDISNSIMSLIDEQFEKILRSCIQSFNVQHNTNLKLDTVVEEDYQALCIICADLEEDIYTIEFTGQIEDKAIILMYEPVSTHIAPVKEMQYKKGDVKMIRSIIDHHVKVFDDYRA